MDAISNVQDFGENDDQDFEIDINGHHISVQYDWGAWDRPYYNSIKVDGKGLSQYSNDESYI